MCKENYARKLYSLYFILGDGGWSEWADFTSCSATCGDQQRKIRMRACNSPPPSNGGRPCDGGSVELVTCGLDPCEGLPALKSLNF